MQREVKIGLVIGVVLVAIGVLFWSQSPESRRPAPFEEPDLIGGEALDPVAPIARLSDVFSEAVFRPTDSPPPSAAEPGARRRSAPAPAPEPVPEPVSAPAAPPRPEPGHRVHVVERGESLWSLAVKYYGNGGKWKAIAEANRSVLPNSDRLTPGMRLVIPPDPDRPVASAAPRMQIPAEASPPAERVKTHVVVAGDNLARISQRYYGTERHWSKLFEANKDRLPSPHVLPVGVELVIPPLS